MSENPNYYNKDMLDEQFKNLGEHLSRQDGKLSSIETQTKLTNGRVSKLEGNYDYLRGALAVIMALIIPVILFGVYQYIKK